MKIVLKYLGKDILSYDLGFDPGVGHLMVVMGCLLDKLVHEESEKVCIEVGVVKTKKE